MVRKVSLFVTILSLGLAECGNLRVNLSYLNSSPLISMDCRAHRQTFIHIDEMNWMLASDAFCIFQVVKIFAYRL